MKKCCKDIDITDAYQIEPFIEECIKNHGKRHDFSVFIKKEGLINEYRQLLNGNISARYEIAIAIAKKIATMIKDRNIPVLKNSYNSYTRFNRAFRYAQKVISEHERNKQHGTSSNIICDAAKNYISANG